MEFALYILIGGVVAICVALLIASYKRANEDGVVTKEEFLEILEDEIKTNSNILVENTKEFISDVKAKIEKRKK